MTGLTPKSGEAYLADVLTQPVSEPAMMLARSLDMKFPGSAIFLYGSGISVSAHEDPSDILFDFYVIVGDYMTAIANPVERLAARLLPPNVYYHELATERGQLRCKYAMLSREAFERLIGRGTFHSYFWARFAQPSRLALCPETWRADMIGAVKTALMTFLQRAQPISDEPADWRRVWLAGLNASYRAELRAEASDRALKLIENYGDWPRQTASFALKSDAARSLSAIIAWRLRALLGAFLSVARLLKATTTFDGGLDYIAWKVKRHAGVDVEVRPWERRHPFLAAPIVALRYYAMRAASRK